MTDMILISILVIYLAAVLAVGEWAARKRVQSLQDYLLAGRREGPWILAATISATVIGAGSTLGLAGVAYHGGISAGWYLWSACLGLLILAVTFAGRLRSSGVYTVPEFLEYRYGPWAGGWATLLGLVGLIFFLAAQFFTLGTLIRSMSPVPLEWGVLLGSLVVIVYTLRGGNVAVHWTDAFQLGLVLFGIFAIGIVSLSAIDGFEAFANPPAERRLHGTSVSAWFNPYTGSPASAWNPFSLGSTVLGWVVMSTTWHFTMQSTAQRLLSSRDPSTASLACFLSALILLPLGGLVALCGMSARILFPDLPVSGDVAQLEAIPAVVRNLLPPLLGGVVLAALVAVVMSTADSALLGASTSALLDGVRRFFKPSLSEAQVLRGVHWATLGIGLLAMGLALGARSLVQMLELVAAVYSGAVFVPLILGFFWKRANEFGACLAITLSALVSVGWRASGWESKTGLHMLLLSLPVGLVTTVVGSLLRAPVAKDP